MTEDVRITFGPVPTVGAIRATLTKLKITKDDYVVITVHQPPHLSRDQAYRIFDMIHEAMPHLDRNHVIVKPPDIEIEIKSAEEVADLADIPSWVRKLRR